VCSFGFFCVCSLPPRFFFPKQGEKKKDRRVYERLLGIFSSRNAIGKGKNRFVVFLFLPVVASLCVGCEERARGEERCARKGTGGGDFFFSFLVGSREKTQKDKRLTLFFFLPRAALETNRNQSIPTAPLSSGPRPGPRTRRDICTGPDWITDSGGTRETIREGD
jgi:hypothetical protein